MRLPLDLVFGCKSMVDLAGDDYVTDLRGKIDETYEKVRSHVHAASDRIKDLLTYAEADPVWNYNP